MTSEELMALLKVKVRNGDYDSYRFYEDLQEICGSLGEEEQIDLAVSMWKWDPELEGIFVAIRQRIKDDDY